MEGTLILVRHGESEWNAKGLWTGLTDIGLTQKGKEEAQKAARAISDIPLNAAFSSPLSRARDTLRIMLETLGQTHVTVEESRALSERDYGVYTGKNKWEVQKSLGEAEFLKLRRSWDYPIENGESLKDVYARVVPYYERHIAPLVTQGKNVLISAHGNSLRALIKYLDHIPDKDISSLELATGEIIVYTIDRTGHVVSRERRLS